MTELTFAVLMLLVLGWAVVSDRLARWNITGPLVFTIFGFVLANRAWGPLTVDVEAPTIHLLAEVTLALLLFADAARVNLTSLRHDAGLPARLLGIGLPLTVVTGSLAAAWMFHDFTWALAGFVGAALAPTDAALSAQVINDERIPTRVRRTLNVESGLNDGIVTPIVVFTLAVAAERARQRTSTSTDRAPPAPRTGHRRRRRARHRIRRCQADRARVATAWILPGGRRLATFAAAIGSFAAAGAMGGNGFIAAFVAGIAFGAAWARDDTHLDEAGEFPELVGEVLSLAVWFLFGAALVPVAFEYLSVWTLVYAVLSLTVIRILPVALAMLGTGRDRATVLFIGWFGPRGLASVVFALLAIEELGASDAAGQAVSVVAFTVLLSVIVHGVTAGPVGRRYGLGHREVVSPVGDAGPRSRRQGHR